MADALSKRIEESPTAIEHGLEVWVDRRGTGSGEVLRPGESWQKQIEEAVADSTAFAVLVPPAGVSFWVDIEMRLGINKLAEKAAAGEPHPFIPIVGNARDLTKLPRTATLFQAAELKSLGDGGDSFDGLDAIIRAALNLDARDQVSVVAEPFMGFSAFDAETAALFFGRERETRELVEKLRATNFVVVYGDSGAGKSSLVKAGLIPRFREGVFADRTEATRPDPAAWHVVQMRPGREPFQGLVNGVADAARAAGLTIDWDKLGVAIRSRDAGRIGDALREAAPRDAKLLLVVDQFEELWTSTADDIREKFIRVLLALAPAGDFNRRVVATMRRDYFNLCSADPALWSRLDSGAASGRFLLRRMDPDGLRAAITKPLSLAGETAMHAKELADAVLRDITDQPGDLALLEMALTEAWRRRRDFEGSVLRAYEHIGRVEGALATAAEEVFANAGNVPTQLSEAERPVAEALFMRLVQVGDAQGATRRVVSRNELTDDGWRVAQKLASAECRRLLVIRDDRDDDVHDGATGGTTDADRPRDDGAKRDRSDRPAPARTSASTAELAHEQLVTQWSRYQGWLRNSAADRCRADDKRQLDRLMDRAARWEDRGRVRGDLASGSDLAEFGALAQRRDGWLSQTERGFIGASRAEQHRQWIYRAASLAAIFANLLTATIVSSAFWRQAENRANTLEAKQLWDAFEFQGGRASPREIESLWKLAQAPPDVRAAFVGQILTNDDLATRFARAPTAITHALVGLDRERRSALANAVMTRMPTSLECRVAVAFLAIEIENTAAFEAVLSAIKETADLDQAAALGTGLAALADKLGDEQAALAVDPLLAAIKGTVHSRQVAALGTGLAALAVKLGDEQAVRAFDHVLAAIKGTTDSGQVAALGTGLATLASNLGDEQAARAVDPLLAAINGATDSNHLATLGDTLVALLGGLSDEKVVGRSMLDAMRVPHMGAASFRSPWKTHGRLDDALRLRFEDAPPKEQGFWALIEWAEKRFPDFDFKTPPQRPHETAN